METKKLFRKKTIVDFFAVLILLGLTVIGVDFNFAWLTLENVFGGVPLAAMSLAIVSAGLVAIGAHMSGYSFALDKAKHGYWWLGASLSNFMILFALRASMENAFLSSALVLSIFLINVLYSYFYYLRLPYFDSVRKLNRAERRKLKKSLKAKKLKDKIDLASQNLQLDADKEYNKSIEQAESDISKWQSALNQAEIQKGEDTQRIISFESRATDAIIDGANDAKQILNGNINNNGRVSQAVGLVALVLTAFMMGCSSPKQFDHAIVADKSGSNHNQYNGDPGKAFDKLWDQTGISEDGFSSEAVNLYLVVVDCNSVPLVVDFHLKAGSHWLIDDRQQRIDDIKEIKAEARAGFIELIERPADGQCTQLYRGLVHAFGLMSPNAERSITVLGDLIESGDAINLGVYAKEPNKLIEDSDKIISILEGDSEPLPQLKGVQARFVFDVDDGVDNLTYKSYQFFKAWFESKGARVIPSASL